MDNYGRHMPDLFFKTKLTEQDCTYTTKNKYKCSDSTNGFYALKKGSCVISFCSFFIIIQTTSNLERKLSLTVYHYLTYNNLRFYVPSEDSNSGLPLGLLITLRPRNVGVCRSANLNPSTS